MTNQENYSVGIYTRLSHDDERVGESVSIENQKRIFTQYVKEMGWHLEETYCDNGFTGVNFERPGFQRMLEDVKSGRINLVLVKDLSRFGRNYIQVGQFTDYLFPSLGVRFIALNDGVDTIHNENDILPFRSLFNEFYSRDTSKKVKSVKRACAQNGLYVGNWTPYGYVKDPQDKHRFLVDEYAAGIVRRIFEMRCLGYGYYKIAGELNREGILPPRDYLFHCRGEENPYRTNHHWNDVTVKKLLINEAYIGNMVQLKKGTLSYKVKKIIDKPQEEWVRVEHTHEPIIDRETWDKVQAIRQNPSRTRSTQEGGLTLFSGLLNCAGCGFKMRYGTDNQRRKDGTVKKYGYYLCGNYARSGRTACSTHTIYLEPLSLIVLGGIRGSARRVLADEDSVRQELFSRHSEHSARQNAADRKALKEAEARMGELDHLMQSLYEDRVNGKIPERLFDSLMQKYEAERGDVQQCAEGLKSRIADAEQGQADIDTWLSLIRKYVAVEQLDREMLLELIDHIDVGERRFENGVRRQDIDIFYKFVGKVD